MRRFLVPMTDSQLDRQRRQHLEEIRESREEEQRKRAIINEIRVERIRMLGKERSRRFRERIRATKLSKVPASVDIANEEQEDVEALEIELNPPRGPNGELLADTPVNSDSEWLPDSLNDTEWDQWHRINNPNHTTPENFTNPTGPQPGLQPETSQSSHPNASSSDLRTFLSQNPSFDLASRVSASPPRSPSIEPAFSTQNQLAEASRPWHQFRRDQTRKPCGRIPQIRPYVPKTRMNWFNPLIWRQIDGAAKKASWSPSGTLRFLLEWNPETFQKLARTTISRWMEHGTHGFRFAWWDPATLRKVEEGRPLVLTHRAGILDQFQNIKDIVIEQLQAIRATGCRITVVGTRAIVISYFQVMSPGILQTWKVSDSWTRDFLRHTMGWSIRRGTTAAQKLPDSWEKDAIRTCLRMAYLIRHYGIPIFFVLNMDETGVLLQPGGDVTYAQTGSRDVPIAGVEDKRQFTLLVTTSMQGDLLPFASLWMGKTSASLPKPEFAGPAESQGHRFFFAGEKHWSTVRTMQLWVREIVIPYRDKMLALFPQYTNTPIILYLDVYWCHRCDEFLNWIEELRETGVCWFIVLFVAANTTSVNQPCDVGLQRPIKHELKRQHMASAILETSDQLRQPGMKPENVRLDVSIKHLRDQTPRWLSNTFDIVQKTNAGKIAWERSCKTGIFDLSYKTLTSFAVFDYMHNVLPEIDPDFSKLLQHKSSIETIRPVIDNRKVVVEMLAPGAELPVELTETFDLGPYGQLYTNYEDGIELETELLISLINEDTFNAGVPVGVGPQGSFYLSSEQEDINYGYTEGWTGLE